MGISFKIGMDQVGKVGPGIFMYGTPRKYARSRAGQCQNETDRHLGLVERDATKGDDQGHQRTDQHSGQKTQYQAAGQISDRKAAHGREQDGPVQGQVDDACAFGDRLADHSKQDRCSGSKDSCQTNQGGIVP